MASLIPRQRTAPFRTAPRPALPFDRLVYDRDRAEQLWDFRYRLEMFVPKEKREYGYYVLPLLVGDQVVGRIEPGFDREDRTAHGCAARWEHSSPASIDRPLSEPRRLAGARSS